MQLARDLPGLSGVDFIIHALLQENEEWPRNP